MGGSRVQTALGCVTASVGGELQVAALRLTVTNAEPAAGRQRRFS